ncbi:MAG: nucleoside transporter [Ponticaulis sp.]|nr:nucleoside transporter [Ponticaulis sp.]|tara:strand:+ start:21851 stop:23617 length:1767 start_codon:yes stop_codon:yes gene_type:complete
MTDASINAQNLGSGDEPQGLDHVPVPPNKLQPAGYFAGNYAGEHVAGTEFVIGALFAGAGAAASDVILGLLLGNLLAVLTWAFVTSPIAVDTRLTLYAYLEKIAGRHFIKLYSVVNGIMFLGLAGSMITVSASAVRVMYNSLLPGSPIEAQTGYFPTDIRFILIALAVGAVVVTLAVLGFRRLAQFAGAVVPWMICMFLVGALALYPMLASAAGATLPATSLSEIWTVLSTQVYQPTPMEGAFWGIPNEAKSFWSIAAFAWVANLAMHGSLGDMTLLRFAKRKSYGWFSALGMFIGHFACWVFAGVMGAGAAYTLTSDISQLDPGAVATTALGGAGVIAVIVAGWTTSNPTLYRAGLAFQSLNPKWSRGWVTLIVGVATMILACSPFVFSQLLGYVGWMGLTLSPVGAVIVAEHWLFKPLGLNRYWNSYRKSGLNLAAVIAWAAAFAVIVGFYFGLGIHQFFLLIPAWITATIVYILCAKAFGAAADYPKAAIEEAAISQRQKDEADYLASGASVHGATGNTKIWWAFQGLSYLALAWIVASAVRLIFANGEAYQGMLNAFRDQLIWPTLVFFLCAAAVIIIAGEKRK